MTDTPFCRILCNTSIKFEQYRFRKYLSEYGGIPIKRQESNVITWKIWRTLLLIYLNRKHKNEIQGISSGRLLYLHIHTACILCLHFSTRAQFHIPQEKECFCCFRAEWENEAISFQTRMERGWQEEWESKKRIGEKRLVFSFKRNTSFHTEKRYVRHRETPRSF